MGSWHLKTAAKARLLSPDSSFKQSVKRQRHLFDITVKQTLSTQHNWVERSTTDLTESTCKQGNFKMDEQTATNASNTPHQVIYIIQAPKDKVNIKDVYNIKAATALGIIHIICGLIALGSDIAGMVNEQFAFATGIWTSVFFFVSGGLAIGGARSGNKCLVVATMVMSIISAVSAGILLIMSALALEFFGNRYYYRQIGPYSYALLIAMGATMLIVAIASASLTCTPLCCRSTKQGVVHYKPNQVPASMIVNADQISALNLPPVQDLQAQPSTSVKLLSESAEPPTYQDVAGVGSKYQKF